MAGEGGRQRGAMENLDLQAKAALYQILFDYIIHSAKILFAFYVHLNIFRRIKLISAPHTKFLAITLLLIMMG